MKFYWILSTSLIIISPVFRLFVLSEMDCPVDSFYTVSAKYWHYVLIAPPTLLNFWYHMFILIIAVHEFMCFEAINGLI